MKAGGRSNGLNAVGTIVLSCIAEALRGVRPLLYGRRKKGAATALYDGDSCRRAAYGSVSGSSSVTWHATWHAVTRRTKRGGYFAIHYVSSCSSNKISTYIAFRVLVVTALAPRKLHAWQFATVRGRNAFCFLCDITTPCHACTVFFM